MTRFLDLFYDILFPKVNFRTTIFLGLQWQATSPAASGVLVAAALAVRFGGAGLGTNLRFQTAPKGDLVDSTYWALQKHRNKNKKYNIQELGMRPGWKQLLVVV